MYLKTLTLLCFMLGAFYVKASDREDDNLKSPAASVASGPQTPLGLRPAETVSPEDAGEAPLSGTEAALGLPSSAAPGMTPPLSTAPEGSESLEASNKLALLEPSAKSAGARSVRWAAGFDDGLLVVPAITLRECARNIFGGCSTLTQSLWEKACDSPAGQSKPGRFACYVLGYTGRCIVKGCESVGEVVDYIGPSYVAVALISLDSDTNLVIKDIFKKRVFLKDYIGNNDR